MIDEKVKGRFLSKIKKQKTGCWEWQAGLRTGYGIIKVEGKSLGAHRLSWMIYNGDMPEGLYVCHKCDNPKCVNPDHLFIGSHSDNMKDAFNKGRLIIPKGRGFEINHYPLNTKIPKTKAIEVKAAVFNRESRTLKQVSIDLNVPYQYVRDISCGRILKTLVGAE